MPALAVYLADAFAVGVASGLAVPAVVRAARGRIERRPRLVVVPDPEPEPSGVVADRVA